jgi:hypothetical protein
VEANQESSRLVNSALGFIATLIRYCQIARPSCGDIRATAKYFIAD